MVNRLCSLYIKCHYLFYRLVPSAGFKIDRVLDYTEEDVEHGRDQQEEQALPGFRKYTAKGWHRYMLGRYLYALKYAYNKRVLDAGCGFGWGAYLLSGKPRELTAVDIDEKAIRFAKKTWDETGVDFIVHSVLCLEELGKKFDVILSFEVIEHFSLEDGKRYLQSIGNCLADNGVLVMSSFFPREEAEARKSQAGNKYHLHIYTSNEIGLLLASAGMKTIRLFGEFMLVAKKT